MNRLRALIAAFLVFASFGAGASSFLPGFDDLEQQLRLNARQKAQFDVAVAATQRALFSVALGAMQVKDRVAAELAKPKPDLAELARAQDELVEQSRPLFREARDEWTRLYAMLDPDQVATTRAFVEDRLRRLEDVANAVRDLIVDKLGQRQ